MVTDVSQHRLRQEKIPVDWSDRVRTQLSSWEANSIQAEVMWPALRLLAQYRQTWAEILLAYLSVYLSVCLSVCLSVLVLKPEVLSAVNLSAQIWIIVSMPEIYLQPQWLICTAHPVIFIIREESKCTFCHHPVIHNTAAAVQSISQSINQSINQSIYQPTNQPVNQSINQSINCYLRSTFQKCHNTIQSALQWLKKQNIRLRKTDRT